jgi:hypothetical protein
LPAGERVAPIRRVGGARAGRRGRVVTVLGRVAAQAALGVGAVALAVTGAGMADILPSQAANERIQRAVTAITGIELDSGTAGPDEPVSVPVPDTGLRQDAPAAARDLGEATRFERRAERVNAERAAAAVGEEPDATGREPIVDTPGAERVPAAPGPSSGEGRAATGGQQRGDAAPEAPGAPQRPTGPPEPARPDRPDAPARPEPARPGEPEAGGGAGNAPADPPASDDGDRSSRGPADAQHQGGIADGSLAPWSRP